MRVTRKAIQHYPIDVLATSILNEHLHSPLYHTHCNLQSNSRTPRSGCPRFTHEETEADLELEPKGHLISYLFQCQELSNLRQDKFSKIKFQVPNKEWAAEAGGRETEEESVSVSGFAANEPPGSHGGSPVSSFRRSGD